MSHPHPSSSGTPKSKTKHTKITSHSPSSEKHDKKKHNKMGDENATTNNYKMFMFFNRKFKIRELSPPPDVKELFSKFAAGADVMSPDQFCNFLIEHQHEKVSLADAKRILHEFSLRRHHTMEPKKDKDKKKEHRTAGEHGLTLDDFFNFLFEEEFNGPIKHEVHHDMTAPLSHYFIYTGHNSYLTGNQLSSDCSDVPIIRALEKGVKVIELDLWRTSSKEDVQVYHGRTLTAPVTLVKCLKSIRKHAFVKSSYPVVITFEDHLTTKLRVKVAELVTQIFGDILYYPKLEDPMTEFLSPEALKHRIIISTKPPVVGEGNDKDSSEESEVSDSDREAESKAAVDIKPVQSEAPEYASLITIHAGKPRAGLKEALEVGEKVRRLSLSEQKLEKAAEDHGADIVRFTQRNILRIYPKGTRVTSTNYKPHVGWMHGAQMVAFNMQGRDKLLELMHGMFRANGGCGYLKKPAFLMHRGPNNEVFDPKRTLMATKTLKVKVYMGNGWRLNFSQTHFDRFSPPDFYTKVYIVGVPADCVKHKTEIIYDEWMPVWNQEFTYRMSVPELAILRIEVRDSDRSDKDDFGGQTCLPVSELKSGIRSVPLYDHKGEKYTYVRLLMRFQFESSLAPA